MTNQPHQYLTTQFLLGMLGIKKCLTIIYRLKKYRDTGILRYLVTSSVVDNFCKNPTVRIIRSALPILFVIYVSDIIFKHSASGRGWHISGIYATVLMYADGLLLMSSLQILVILRKSLHVPCMYMQ